MCEGSARRLMEHQRLQACAPEPVQEIVIPWRVARRQHAETQMMRAANRRMQIKMPAHAVGGMGVVKRRHRLLKFRHSGRFIGRWKLLPALTKHAVHITMQVTSIITQRGRVPQNHQQPPAQNNISGQQPGKQCINHFYRRGFVTVDAC